MFDILIIGIAVFGKYKKWWSETTMWVIIIIEVITLLLTYWYESQIAANRS